jgi:hypothetical protein
MGNADLGWAKITHPFHPLRGQRFKVVKTRKVAGQDTLILEGTQSGTFAIAREWTNQADHQTERPTLILSFQCLRELMEIVSHIREGSTDKGD